LKEKNMRAGESREGVAQSAEGCTTAADEREEEERERCLLAFAVSSRGMKGKYKCTREDTTYEGHAIKKRHCEERTVSAPQYRPKLNAATAAVHPPSCHWRGGGVEAILSAGDRKHTEEKTVPTTTTGTNKQKKKCKDTREDNV
jgi:hypothetical protein